MIGIYSIHNTTNGKRYIGQSKDVMKRRVVHFSALKKGNHPNHHLQRSFNKYGKEFFEWSILEETPENMLDIRESAWIGYYQSNDSIFGYNKDSGGKSNKRRSPETCRKMSEFRKGFRYTDASRRRMSESHKNPSYEVRRRMSEAHRGKTSTFLGKHHSAASRIKLSNAARLQVRNPCSKETRDKIGMANKGKLLGRLLSEETKKKISESNRGRIHSEDTRRKISQSNKGKHPSDETRKKMSESRMGMIFTEKTLKKRSESLKLAWQKRKALLASSVVPIVASLVDTPIKEETTIIVPEPVFSPQS